MISEKTSFRVRVEIWTAIAGSVYEQLWRVEARSPQLPKIL